ncbi:MAG: hypothetical protein IT207_11610 [Fimbriimonadaceae bacterium]|nr:hypothetical protein [Fimbriimonadaceae bacterium]
MPTLALPIFVLLCAMSSATQERGGSFGVGEGGFGSGGAAGGQAGGAGGRTRGGSGTAGDRRTAEAVQHVEAALYDLLGDEFQTHILTPGEFTEWTVEMKADEVLIAEARSTAFDAGLEVVDAAGTSLAANDDRYLGDQRPLLLWRAPEAGTFTLRGRSFRDRAGGQYEIHFRVLPSLLIEPGGRRTVERKHGSVLLRLPLKRGMFVQPVSNEEKFAVSPAQVNFRYLLTPGGLPNRDRMSLFADLSARRLLFAPVDGDYDLVANFGQDGGSELSIRTVVPQHMSRDKPTALVQDSGVQLYEFEAEKGEILEVASIGQPGAYLSEIVRMPELPVPGDQNWMDPRKQETQDEQTPEFTPLITRVGDSSKSTALFHEGGKYLVSISNFRVPQAQFRAQLSAPLRPMNRELRSSGALKIGESHYWSFVAEPGQYIRLELSSQEFAAQMTQISENGQESNKVSPLLDSESVSRQFLVTAPGRQIVRVSCLGDGGKGGYQLSCAVAPSQDCSLVKPAEGRAESGETRVVRMELEAGVPYLAQFDGPISGLYFTFADLQGFARNVVMRRKSPERQYALLYSPEKLSLLVVVSGINTGGDYKVSLSELP